MTRPTSYPILSTAIILGLLTFTPAAAQDASAPLALAAARVSIAGTSNIHEFTASTTDVKVTRLVLADGIAGAGMLTAALNPGSLEAFEIVVKAGTAAFVEVFCTVNAYCTKSPIAATVVGVDFCMNSCVAAGSIGTSIATAGGASIAKDVPNDAALNRYGAPDS